jgi:putative ABC transport system permease protein
MRYFPLIWAALTRKKLRLLLTLLSVTTAFILFGMMIGFRASLDHLSDLARPDRIFATPRFSAAPLPESLQQQLLAIPGVSHVAMQSFVVGYYRDPHDTAIVIALDPGARSVLPELSATQAQLDTLNQDLTAVYFSRAYAQRFGKKVGDTFPIKAPAIPRADGGQSWIFHIIGLIDDMDSQPGGFALTSLKAVDQAKPPASRYKGVFFRILVSDPKQGDAMAQRIDQIFANSGTPTTSITEKNAYGNSFASIGIDIGFVTLAVAGAGLFMILFLAGNSIAQSVRERIGEFAVLKTIGYSDAAVIALVVAEAMVPCLTGAVLGVGVSAWLARIFQRLLPPVLPAPMVNPSVAAYALIGAAVVALLAAAIPASRIARLDIATALSGRS